MYNLLDKVDGSGQRFNNDKIKLGQIPPVALQALDALVITQPLGTSTYSIKALSDIAEHFMLGQAKYPDKIIDGTVATMPNWSAGMLFNDMFIESCYRHIYAYKYGEILDSEFNAHHLRAVSWGFMCLLHMFYHYDNYKQFDDRMWVGVHVQEPTIFYTKLSKITMVNQLCQVIRYIQACEVNKSPQKVVLILSYGIILCLELMNIDLQYTNITPSFRVSKEFRQQQKSIYNQYQKE